MGQQDAKGQRAGRGGDAFKNLRATIRRYEGHYHILEQPVPLECQIAYFKFSQRIRKRNYPSRPIADAECERLYGMLCAKGADEASRKRYLLTQLATSESVSAYRMLEAYVKEPSKEVAEWSYMALMDARIMLSFKLSGEEQAYISVGLGGRGEKMRMCALLFAKDAKPFEPYQRQVIEREFPFYLAQLDCEIERLTVGERHVELRFLLPMLMDVEQSMERLIVDCNEYGDFLAMSYSLTNCKEYTAEEIEELIIRNGNN